MNGAMGERPLGRRRRRPDADARPAADRGARRLLLRPGRGGRRTAWREASFDLPAFNGTVRLMAVAWSPTGVGQAATDVLVRDPVVVTASLPRFLAPGDQLAPAAGDRPCRRARPGAWGSTSTARGRDASTSAVPSGADRWPSRASRPLCAPDHARARPGVHDDRRRADHAGRQAADQDADAAGRGQRPRGRAHLAASRCGRARPSPSTTTSSPGCAPGTGCATLSVGPLARFDAPGLLAALDRYPYGCTEQVTSQALPLLYFDARGRRRWGWTSAASVDERIEQAITRGADATRRRTAPSACGAPDSGDLWLDAYVTDFLSRARAQGFDVPDAGLPHRDGQPAQPGELRPRFRRRAARTSPMR